MNFSLDMFASLERGTFLMQHITIITTHNHDYAYMAHNRDYAYGT